MSRRDIANVDHPFDCFDFLRGLSSPGFMLLSLIGQMANAPVAPAQISG
jgi:hypothetical protein